MSQICQLLLLWETTLVASSVVCAALLWLVCIEVSLRAHTRFYYVFPLLRAQGMTFWVTLDPTKENAPRWYKSARIQKQLVENGRAAWGANPRGVLSGALFFIFFLLLFAPLFSHAAVSPVWQTHAHEYNVYKQGFLNDVDNGWTRLRSRRFYGLTNFYIFQWSSENAFWPTSEAKRVSQQSQCVNRKDGAGFCMQF